MKHALKSGLRMRLNLLILLTLLPAGILLFFAAEDQRRIESGAFLKHALLLAQAGAVEEAQQVSAARDLLLILSNYLRLPSVSLDQTIAFLSTLTGQFRGYRDIGVLSPQGVLMVNSRRDPSGANYGDHTWFRQVAATKQFAMGEYRVQQLDAEPVIYFGLPVMDDRERVAEVVFAAMSLNQMNRSIFRLLDDLPPGASLTQIDASGKTLSYAPETGAWSESGPVSPAVLEAVSRRETGILEAADDDGTLRIYAFAPLKSAIVNRHVYISLHMPKRLALAASNRFLFLNLTLFALVMLLAVGVIRWGSDVFIIRRIEAIVETSRSLAGGDLGARVGDIGGRDELTWLARSFDDMADSLEARELKEAAARKALRESREQLRNLAAYLQSVREQERTRIAREIHDDFGQALTILKMDLSWLKKRLDPAPAEDGTKIEAMFQTIEGALKTLHAVSAALRPVILDDFGLAAAIEWQAEEFQERSGIACRVDAAQWEADPDRELATALFRIFQETLTNIIRHAGAGRVDVRLASDDGGWLLEVADDGRGISPAEIEHPRSFGLIGMRERLWPWNGTVAFQRRSTGGTRVSVRVPRPSKGESS
jgi:signal transduction histidine kinase